MVRFVVLSKTKKMTKFRWLIISCIFITAIKLGIAQGANNEQLLSKAKKLAQKYIIVDGHVDLPYRLRISNFRLQKEYLGIPYQTDSGECDYVRSKEGGLDAPFMCIYIPSSFTYRVNLAGECSNFIKYYASIFSISQGSSCFIASR